MYVIKLKKNAHSPHICLPVVHILLSLNTINMALWMESTEHFGD